jgi:hypothetical protein
MATALDEQNQNLNVAHHTDFRCLVPMKYTLCDSTFK